MSTEATVRNAIVAAIEAVYADLGFDDVDGNVKDYLPEYHHKENIPGYFMAMVSGKNIARVVAVQVLAGEDDFTSTSVVRRSYQITIKGFYEVGEEGEGINALLSGMSKVREAIFGMGTNLSSTVTRFISIESSGIEVLQYKELGNSNLVAQTLRIQAEKIGVDF